MSRAARDGSSICGQNVQEVTQEKKCDDQAKRQAEGDSIPDGKTTAKREKNRLAAAKCRARKRGNTEAREICTPPFMTRSDRSKELAEAVFLSSWSVLAGKDT